VELAYRQFWAVAITVDSRPVRDWRPALADVAAEPLLTRIYDGLRALRAAGRRQYGSVVVHLRVLEVRSRRASVVDCQDASRTGELDLQTGVPRTVGSASTPVAAALVRGRDSQWRVCEARYLEGTC
jgi:hypothetical protein